jgi:hypothetical protein
MAAVINVAQTASRACGAAMGERGRGGWQVLAISVAAPFPAADTVLVNHIPTAYTKWKICVFAKSTKKECIS